MQILAYLLARFSEPSSYAGLSAALALLGLHLPDPALAAMVQLLAAGCGLVALLLKERGLIAAIMLVFALAPILSACGGLVAADTTIATACSEYTKAKAAADIVTGTGLLPATVTGKVTSIESFGDAACANPPAGDPLSTAIWLGQLAGQIGTLATGG
jgi:hypothetical protein